MDYISFCKHFFAATGIPTVLHLDGHLVHSALADVLSIQPLDAWTIYTPSRNPEFCCINPDLEYGHVRIEGTGYDLLVYGERTLSEISAYLGYSSQSYFQNVFKKQYGITPMQYRKQNRKQVRGG